MEAHPEAELRVYAVWFNVLPSDHRSRWDEDLLTDPRATHYWDEERILGRWYKEVVGFPYDVIAWDVGYLYGPEAVWDDTPGPYLGIGHTIIGQKDALMRALEPFLDSVN